MACSNSAEQNAHYPSDATIAEGSSSVVRNHGLIDKLSVELKYKIVKALVVPVWPCAGHLFDRCYDSWSCRLPHLALDTQLPRVTPDPQLTSLCPFIHTQGHDAFFKHNLFVIKGTSRFIVERDMTDARSGTLERQHRDSRAHMILDSLDYPIWRADPSLYVFDDSSYDPVDEHRHKIRHLVLLHDRKLTFWGEQHECCNWVFRIRWKSLKHLEILYVDFRQWGFVYSSERDTLNGFIMWQTLKSGLEGMARLQLQSLVLVGLCSPSKHGPALEQEEIEGMFRPLLRDGGDLEFWDNKEPW